MPEDSGEIHLVFDFQGPPGVAYPQYQPNVDSYDERNRVNVEDKLKSGAMVQKTARTSPKDMPRCGVVVVREDLWLTAVVVVVVVKVLELHVVHVVS